MYTAGYSSGVGAIDIFDPSTYTSGGGIDTSNWDWHEWALAIVGGYLVVRTIFRGGRSVKEGVGKKVRKVGGGLKKRKRALKTVFTG
jgi:hypothetical protein